MLKNIYIVTKHSYWEHYNAKPQKTEYETKEEALKAANDYESRWFMEDGYYATVHKRLPESCQKIRTVSLDYLNDEMVLDLFF